MNGERICRTMIDLALGAGAGILKHFRSQRTMTWTKEDESPVTEADMEADQVIRHGLSREFPGAAIVSEEQLESHALRPTDGSFFIVDPLDGTRSFISGKPDFTVNIGYVVKSKPVFGVVYAPASGRMFYTRPDGSSAESNMDGALGSVPKVNGKTLSVSLPDNEALVVIASRSHANAATEAYISRYRIAGRQAAGSSLKFCLVAAGEADFYPRYGRTMEWDTAAGHAVLSGAGGDVVRLDDGSSLTYGKPGYVNPDFVAFSPGVVLR